MANETNGKKPPKVTGRPLKLTPELQKLVCLYIESGNYIETAAICAGISKQTFYDWVKKGKAAKSGIYRNFSDAVETAVAKSEARDVQVITKAANAGQWQASAWRLERKFPDKYGRKDKMDMNHSGAVAVQIIDDIPKIADDGGDD